MIIWALQKDDNYIYRLTMQFWVKRQLLAESLPAHQPKALAFCDLGMTLNNQISFSRLTCSNFNTFDRQGGRPVEGIPCLLTW